MIMKIPYNDGYSASFINVFKSSVRDRSLLINYLNSKITFEKAKSDSINQTYDYSVDFGNMVRMFKPLIPEGSIAIDIGASCGDTTVPIAALVGDHGECIAFEPGETFPVLENQKKLNPHLNIKCFNFGIAEENKEYEFRYDYHNGGIESPQIHIGYFPDSKKLPCKNFYSALEGTDLSRIKFIKVDTEGYDINILNDIGRAKDSVIIKNRPNLFIEWWCGEEAKMASFCNEFKYVPINPYTKTIVYNLNPAFRCHDLILLPAEQLTSQSSQGFSQPSF